MNTKTTRNKGRLPWLLLLAMTSSLLWSSASHASLRESEDDCFGLSNPRAQRECYRRNEKDKRRDLRTLDVALQEKLRTLEYAEKLTDKYSSGPEDDDDRPGSKKAGSEKKGGMGMLPMLMMGGMMGGGGSMDPMMMMMMAMMGGGGEMDPMMMMVMMMMMNQKKDAEQPEDMQTPFAGPPGMVCSQRTGQCQPTPGFQDNFSTAGRCGGGGSIGSNAVGVVPSLFGGGGGHCNIELPTSPLAYAFGNQSLTQRPRASGGIPLGPANSGFPSAQSQSTQFNSNSFFGGARGVL